MVSLERCRVLGFGVLGFRFRGLGSSAHRSEGCRAQVRSFPRSPAN